MHACISLFLKVRDPILSNKFDLTLTLANVECRPPPPPLVIITTIATLFFTRITFGWGMLPGSSPGSDKSIIDNRVELSSTSQLRRQNHLQFRKACCLDALPFPTSRSVQHPSGFVQTSQPRIRTLLLLLLPRRAILRLRHQ